MPIYEFNCLECNHGFEILITDSSEVVSCNNCGSIKIKKLFSNFGVNSNSSDYSISDQSYGCGCNSGCGCVN